MSVQIWGAIYLTTAERDQVVSLLRDAELEGSYYGNKRLYWQRHRAILAKLGEVPK